MSKRKKIDNEMFERVSKLSVKCKCGHTMLIKPNSIKEVCTWCGRYVYRDDKQ